MSINKTALQWFYPNKIDYSDQDNYSEAIRSAKTVSFKELEDERLKAISYPTTIVWSAPIPFSNFESTGTGTNQWKTKYAPLVKRGRELKGIYFLINSPTNEMYIGRGNLGCRIRIANKIFTNNGKKLNHELSGSGTDHTGARKMYNFDPNINNWVVRYMEVSSKILCKNLEDELIQKLKPLFNDLTMGGV